MQSLVQHHIKYKEIHGVDEIKIMERGEHKKLHDRLRKEGKCNVPVKALQIISSAAHQRTRKAKNRKGKYEKASRQIISFDETVGANVRVMERVRYNRFTNFLFIDSHFHASNGKIMPIISERIA